jgi:hypothetical protein
MVEIIRGLTGWCCKIYENNYRFWRWRIMKQDEWVGNLEVIVTIGLGSKSSNHWKTNKKQSWKWKGIYKAYKNPILEYDVGQMNFDN